MKATVDEHWEKLRAELRTVGTNLEDAQREIHRLDHLLAERLSELKEILDLIPVGVAISEDPGCQSIKLNRMGSEMHLLPPGLNVSKSHPEGQETEYRVLVDGREMSAEALPMQKACATGEPVQEQEIELVRQDGSTVTILMSATPLFDDEGTVRGAVGAFLDVTQSRADRREAETRARQQRAVARLGLRALQAETVQEIFNEAVHVVRDTLDVEFVEILECLPGEDGLLLRAGVGWEEDLVGTTRVPVGHNSQAGFTLLSDGPVIVEDLEKEDRFTGPELLSRHGVRSGVTTIIPARDGPWGVLGAQTQALRSFETHDVHFIQAVASMISAVLERELVEEQLRQSEAELALRVAQEGLRRAERLASIGTLAAGIAHEINNPINSILMTAETLLEVPGRLESSDELRQDLSIIVDEAERCGEVVKNVLDFARDDGLEKSTQSLNDLVRRGAELVSTYAQQAGAQVTLDLADDLPPLKLNATEIEQVVVHLMQNAIQVGGDDLSLVVQTSRGDGKVRLTVEDDGPGMRPDIQRHVFDPFFTSRRSAGGTGMGLALVHAIVREHDGSIHVESAPGEGSCFLIDFPIPEEA